MRGVHAAIIGLVGLIATDAMAFCGDGTVDGNEFCDGDPCCTATCEPVPDGTLCDPPPGPCRLTSACYDLVCFEGDIVADDTPCDDGDPCTVGDTCRSAVCIAGGRQCEATTSATDLGVEQILTAPAAFLTVDCTSTTDIGATCTAAAFLPTPPPDGIPQGASMSPAPDVTCDFTRQISRTAMRPFTAGGARLRLKLSKLGRRLMRMAATSLPATMTVCTRVDLADGQSFTQVDTVTVRP